MVDVADSAVPRLGCANHPMRGALTRCRSCRRPLCETCFRSTVDGEPWCEACIADLMTAARGRWPLAITLLAVSVAGTIAGWRHETRDGGEPTLGLWVCIGIGALALSAALVLQKPERDAGRKIEKRDADDELYREIDGVEDSVPPVGNPYRTRLRRVVRALAPPLSGRATAVVMALSLALPAIAVPLSLGLPRWLELEIVLGSWWLIWAGALGVLLYRGFRLSDDYVLRAPRPPWVGKEWNAVSVGCADAGCSALAAEVTVIVLVAAAALALAFGAVWLLVELVVPIVFFLTYLVLRGSLARVANDEHDCEGSASRALGWGALWASVYVAPLALVVWVVQMMFR